MIKLSTKQIRSAFIDYFVKNQHVHVPSSPLIPKNDPTLMFTNSGMVQFKDIFTGLDKREYTRATSNQKAVRLGGKHNDLEHVGYTKRHHTFFEMLGNFSFGDYFKEEAIYYAWHLLTKVFSLPKEKLYITVFHKDEEALAYWKKIANLADDKIIKIITNDNFWSMGETGPCGPCSEIFYDHGDKIFGTPPGNDSSGERYVEIWNLVFMQFEQINKDTRIALPKKSVDTGMGLERIAAVIQGVHDNYDIDFFKEIIESAESLLKISAKGENRFSYKIIADHLRSSVFLIADGVIPSSEGRGYVLRRIIRRAICHTYQLVRLSKPLIYKLVPTLVALFAETFPEIQRAESFITNIIQEEEERFHATLDKGLKILEEQTQHLSSGSQLSGKIAFKLYDTYGFPLDLTQDVLRKRNITIDTISFQQMMELQKKRAKKAWAGSGELKTDDLWFKLLSKFGPTEFVGYDITDCFSQAIALVINGACVKKILEQGQIFTLITQATPFYAESGGQMGDVGFITSTCSKIKVLDTSKHLGKIHAHLCELEAGIINENDEVQLSIDKHHRKHLRIHHSATHLLHTVLKDTLGEHVVQKGSLVAYNKLRFDITHSTALTESQIDLIEDKVNQIIIANLVTNTRLMHIDAAIKSGAVALFGEKYEEEVRVVSIGDINNGFPHSLELCSGTHVARTGDIGIFKIVHETGIGAGIRRIEAVCADYALLLIRENEKLLTAIINNLRTHKQDVLQKVNFLIQNNKQLEKDLEKKQLEILNLSSEEINRVAKTIENNIKLIYRRACDVNFKLVRITAQNIIKSNHNVIVIYTTKVDSKLVVLIGISENIVPYYKANNIAKRIATIINGSGGGKLNFAQVGGDIKKLKILEKELEHFF